MDGVLAKMHRGLNLAAQHLSECRHLWNETWHVCLL